MTFREPMEDGDWERALWLLGYEVIDQGTHYLLVLVRSNPLKVRRLEAPEGDITKAYEEAWELVGYGDPYPK